MYVYVAYTIGLGKFMTIKYAFCYHTTHLPIPESREHVHTAYTNNTQSHNLIIIEFWIYTAVIVM